MQTHHLKTWPTFFDAIMRGEKLFEVRKDDRGFEVGDLLVLEEYDPQTKTFSGRSMTHGVSYIMRATADEIFGLKAGYVIMSLAK